jgi:hypothetical protein
MLKSVVAAFAAVLVFAPSAASVSVDAFNGATPRPVSVAANAPAPAAASVAPSHETSHAAQAPATTIASTDSHSHDSARPSLAPGQSRADYYAWLARAPEHRAQVQAFRDHLAARGLEHVVPVWQLIRTSSSWRQCGADRFEVAPADKWDNIVTTLAFVRDEVRPAVGEVEALSVYRNEALNRCSNGAPQSAHRLFFALDLTPVSADVTRARMIRGICAAHGRNGRAYDTGLGFYSGLRFHVDSSGFRRWGPNGKGATSPCVTGGYA